MASTQDLKHRTKEGPNTDNMNSSGKGRRQKKTAMAKRGLRSLAIALAIPLSLTLADISLFGSSLGYGDAAKPFWFPPLWGIHLARLISSLLMGLSAWLVWAEGGFHRKPMAVALYAAQLALTLAWDPIVFGMGASRVGLVACLVLFWVLVGCSRVFGGVNPTAGDIVMPCLAWAGFLAIVNLYLVYL